MRKEEIEFIAQLLDGMKDITSKLEEAEKRKDTKILESAKKEILQFQWQIKKML